MTQACPYRWTNAAGRAYPSPCHNPQRLDLNTTQIIFDLILQSINETGVNDTRVGAGGFPTFEGCKAVTNTGEYQPTRYSDGEIWTRLTNWKLPLLQLVFLTALPALDLKFKLLVLSRLLGNPIGTIQDLLLKMHDCNQRASHWKRLFREQLSMVCTMRVFCDDYYDWETQELDTAFTVDVQTHVVTHTERPKVFAEYETLWKAIAIIVISYDDFGLGNDVSDGITEVLEIENFAGGVQKEFIDHCIHAAEALAADRYTTLLPIGTAELFFILSIATPFIQIRDQQPITPGVFLNIEAYSIAFSLLFLWVLLTTFLTAVIGVSQSPDRVPRILHRFHTDLLKLRNRVSTRTLPLSPESSTKLNAALRSLTASRLDTPYSAMERASLPRQNTLPQQNARHPDPSDTTHCGRIPSWEPGRWRNDLNERGDRSTISASFRRGSRVFAIALVTLNLFLACIMAWEVPPHGFECRHVFLILMWAIWIASYLISFGAPSGGRRLWWYVWLWDTVFALLVFAIVIATQVGVLNSCGCYTLGGTVNMPLSQFPAVAHDLYGKFKGIFAAITFVAILAFAIVFPVGILILYGNAVRVFLQRDNGQPTFHWLQKLRFLYKERFPLGFRTFIRGHYSNLFGTHYVAGSDASMSQDLTQRRPESSGEPQESQTLLRTADRLDRQDSGSAEGSMDNQATTNPPITHDEQVSRYSTMLSVPMVSDGGAFITSEELSGLNAGPTEDNESELLATAAGTI